MSTKGTGSASPISLPKGGGAIQGIGETFSPDLHTGTGNFSVPIALPQGRNGFQPQIGLAYSTGSGNGPFGLGWALSVPGVTRKTAKGVPRYDDARDTFVLSGAEDLVPVSGGPEGGQRYRPRTEGLFARITHHRGDGGDYWIVESKDGLVSRYGTRRVGGFPAGEADPAAVADPDNLRHVFAWRLTETTDPFGNRIEYRYERDENPVDGPHRWDQLYLSEIRYVDYGDPTDPKYLVHVRFTYEDRPDPFSDYRSGFEIRTARRCTVIAVSTAPDPGPELAVRTYRFVYLDQRPGPPQPLPTNGVSLLSLVRTVGHDGERSEELPPLEFGYSAFEPKRRRYGSFTAPGGTVPDASLGHPEYDLVDLFANGLPSVLQMNGVVRYWRNLGGGRFDRPRAMATAPAGVHLADPGVQLVDADGDGRTDLLVTDGNRGGYFPLAGDGGWDRDGYVPYRRVPSLGLEEPTVRLVDLDGDGITDALRTGTHLELFFNDGKSGWGRTESRSRRAAEVFPDVNLADPRVKLADINGDGLQDIVLVQDGRIDYWPSLGHGYWGRRVTMRGSPRFGDPAAAGYEVGYDPQRLLLADVDGDGVADLVYVGSGSVKVWIGRSGNGWSAPIVVRGTPPITNRDAVRVADMHGTGTAGILWTYDQGTQRESTYKFLDLTGGTKPYLLTSMDNHRGAITRVAYTSSTDFYLADEANPATRWRTRLPFPVQVVARVEVIDQLSGGKLSTEFRYHHGYWDGVEREFRGFGLVEQLDTETFDAYHAGLDDPDRPFVPVAEATFSPPILTRLWFHQGPVGNDGDWTVPSLAGVPWIGDPPALDQLSTSAAFLATLPRRVRRDAVRSLRGQILRTEVYALDGSERQDRPYSVTEHVYGLREEDPPGPGESADRLHIFFPHPVATRSTDWERGGDPKTHVEVTSDYDEYGLARSRTTVAVPRGRAYRLPAVAGGAQYLVTRTETRFARPAVGGRFIVDRPASARTYEIANEGSLALPDLIVAVARGDLTRSVIGQTLSFYDGPAFEGLELGAVGDHGLLVRTESLVFTPALLQEAYGEMTATGILPYLVANAPPAWTAEYPEEFRQRLPALAGFRYRPAGVDSVEGYFAVTDRRCYDVHLPAAPGTRPYGLLVESRDPLDQPMVVAHDRYGLLPVAVTDPAGLVTTAEYDYRVLSPRRAIEPNGNLSVYAFTPLGMVAGIATIGQDGTGDTSAVPSATFAYDVRAFVDRQQPVSVRSTRRVYHANDPEAPPERKDETITAVEYSDGFGRLLQTRAQADQVRFGDVPSGDAGLPANPDLGAGVAVGQSQSGEPRVVVGGWQIYDNKGRVVERYEPYFAASYAYALPDAGTLTRIQKSTTFYDARGQVVRTVNPDGSEQRMVRGVPGTIASPNLSDPTRYEPSPWQTFSYDANDNAGRTHSAVSTGYQGHWNTPVSTTVDALGRTVQSVVRNGPDPSADWYITSSTYDLRGNLTSVVDPLGRQAVATIYDLANRPVRTDLLDAGTRWTVSDAAGRKIEERDTKGALVLHAYDSLGRPCLLWARDGTGDPITLRQRIDYGDAADDQDAARAANRLGRLWRQYDEAGLLTIERYDIKGNVLEKSRRVIRDDPILAVFADAATNEWRVPIFRVDWQPATGQSLGDLADALLDPEPLQTTFAYDALGRATALRYPVDADGQRRTVRPRYNCAGAIDRIELDGAGSAAVPIERIAYNAKGQRLLVVFGNGLMTRYAYESRTAQMARRRTERYTTPAPLTYVPNGNPLQDDTYAYDLAGNLLALHDLSPDSGVPPVGDGPGGPGLPSDEYASFAHLVDESEPASADFGLIRSFTYDPLYRLLTATGRECDAPAATPWSDAPRCHDVTRTRPYTETYQYDPLGNLVELKHLSSGQGFTRTLGYTQGGNRLASLAVGTDVYGYAHDATGNLLQEGAARFFAWDHGNRLRAYRTQARASGSQPAEDRWSEPSIHVHYLYDAAGRRVKKLTRKQGGAVEVAVWIDGFFEIRRAGSSGAVTENRTLQVLDGTKRIAEIRTGPPLPGDLRPAVTYELADHLGSVSVVVDGTGALIDREEFTPYGETSFGSFARKRYRFHGKERDEESGLADHGARYYAPWLARWVSCDPLGPVAGLNPYQFVSNNPINRVDPAGKSDGPACKVDLVIGKYSDVGGHHPIQAAAYTPASGATDPFYNQAVAISQSDGAFTPAIHSDVTRAQKAINEAAWSSVTGEPYSATVGKGGLKVETLEGAASQTNLKPEAAVRTENISFGTKPVKSAPGFSGPGTLPPTATPSFEEAKGYTGLSHATGVVPPGQAKEIVEMASRQREALGSVPLRVPNAPKAPSPVKMVGKGTAVLFGFGVYFAAQDAKAAREEGDIVGETLAWTQAVPLIGEAGTATHLWWQMFKAGMVLSQMKAQMELDQMRQAAQEAYFPTDPVPTGVRTLLDMFSRGNPIRPF